MTDTESGGLERANELVRRYGEHLGVRNADLGPDLDHGFGETGFRYDPALDVLIGRAFVAKAKFDSAKEQGRKNYRKVAKALNDPAIGGMFERGGGYFILDEERGFYALAKDFPLSNLHHAGLREHMDELANLAATWTIHWFFRVARIAHGHEEPPRSPVTRKSIPG